MREYLAMGLPVVAPALGDVARTITDGVNGLLYDPGDARSVARHLIRLAEQPELRRSLGRQGRDLITRTGTWDARMQDLVSFGVMQRRNRSKS
jgi:glycosyltransferase involved in cell wall biosynthesis